MKVAQEKSKMIIALLKEKIRGEMTAISLKYSAKC